MLTDKEKMLWRVAILSGSILLAAGSEAYRVEDTVLRILSLTSYANRECVALFNSLHISVINENGETQSVMKRVSNRKTNLYHIQFVNQISRELVSGDLKAHEAYDLLRELERERQKMRFEPLLTILAGIAFTIMLGGGLLGSMYSIFGSLALVGTQWFLRRINLGAFIPTALEAFAVTFVLSLFHRYSAVNLQLVISGTLMIIFPGTALTTGIREMMKGDYITGSATLAQAILSAGGLALGSGFALSLLKGVIL